MPTDHHHEAQGLPDHVTMPLLTLITQQSLDVDYLHVADRKAASGEVSGPGVHRSTGVIVALFGLLLVVAAVQTSRNVSIDEQSRAALIAQITTKKHVIAGQENRLSALRDDVTADERTLDSITNAAQVVGAELLRLQVRTGFVAVHGEGVRILVDDGPGGEDYLVRDEDLAMLADGLWSAGAEAISINGQRLTALTPIRTSGAAINVNDRPINAPYTILAIGNTSTLQSRFAETTHGLAFYSLVQTLGFQFDMQNSDDVAIPAARMPVLRWARTPEVEDDTNRQSSDKSTDQPSEGATP
jgi:uncharacterized protein YlxW (UPF0749 family)